MCKCSNAVTNVVELCLIELDLFDVNIILLLLLLLFFCVCVYILSVSEEAPKEKLFLVSVV